MEIVKSHLDLDKGIFLVDDDPIALEIAQRKLADAFPIVDVTKFFSAMDSIMALTSIESKRYPGLILLDLNMPLQSGWDFLVYLENRGISVPVIVLSSSINKNDQIKSASFDDVLGFIIKPLTMEKLQDVISSH